MATSYDGPHHLVFIGYTDLIYTRHITSSHVLEGLELFHISKQSCSTVFVPTAHRPLIWSWGFCYLNGYNSYDYMSRTHS